MLRTFTVVALLLGAAIGAFISPSRANMGSPKDCPAPPSFGNGAWQGCPQASDPNHKPKSNIEEWFTKELFEDLFPWANIGHGSHPCLPYSYEAFIIAARYFPEFGTMSRNNGYNANENHKRDVSAFFAHAIQETGANDPSVYNGHSKDDAANCFYRGGLYNWFEGGPTSGFLDPNHPGHDPRDGALCNDLGKYCQESEILSYFYPCNHDKQGSLNKGCYFGRGAIQLSYNFNYGAFQKWLVTQNIHVDLLKDPNQLMTHMNPPLALMSSLWFYMTPQPPKPAMHDIVLGDWRAGDKNTKAGYSGAIFGPTSLIINNECGGEDPTDPGGAGESRRIKAFKWFCKYFNVPAGAAKLLTCKDMPQRFSDLKDKVSWGPDWSQTWKSEKCQCAPATYEGVIYYYQSGWYPDEWVKKNAVGQAECVKSVYANPHMYGMNPSSSACLNY